MQYSINLAFHFVESLVLFSFFDVFSGEKKASEHVSNQTAHMWIFIFLISPDSSKVFWYQVTFYISQKFWNIKYPHLKGCVRYISASSFYMSKREHLWNKEKYFLFHFQISSRSWDFRYSNIMTSSNAQAWDTKHVLLNNLGSKRSLVMKYGQFVKYHKINFFIKKFYEKCGLETSSRPFLIFKESSVKKIPWRLACWFRQILIDLLLHI